MKNRRHIVRLSWDSGPSNCVILYNGTSYQRASEAIQNAIATANASGSDIVYNGATYVAPALRRTGTALLLTIE